MTVRMRRGRTRRSQADEPLLGDFAPEAFALAAFSVVARLVNHMESKGLLAPAEVDALLREAARDWWCARGPGVTRPEVHREVARLIEILADRSGDAPEAMLPRASPRGSV
jgi:hypothetical protein